ncbi:hypothetical protein V0288_20245 [Pannus brasiliensis CCIBt3594]|uniref:Uncharacterized protein n=1 Tax=Pannus brasiliensis CCIBt3594 TaxID=1427578 RepID=A0AAW9R124_9CHRO
MINPKDRAALLRVKNVLGQQRELQERPFSIAVNGEEIPLSLVATLDRKTCSG